MRRLSFLLLLLALAGCAEPLQRGTVANRDDDYFDSFVMPTLLRDCAFQECHGSQERFFRVFGPGRTRWNPPGATPIEPFAALTGAERDYTKQFARGMIDEQDPARSLLLRKPLAMEAGGSSHEGVDKYGRNVYRTPDDEGYLQISEWVFSVMDGAAGSAAPPTAGTTG